VTRAAIALGVELATVARVAVAVGHTSGRLLAILGRIAHVTGLAGARGVAAFSAAALVHRAPDPIIAFGGAAARAAGSRLAVRARAALFAVRAQGGEATFAIFARADGARVVVSVALRVAAAVLGAARTFTAERERRIGGALAAEIVLAEVVGASVGSAAVLVVALLERVAADQDAAGRPRPASVFDGAVLSHVARRVLRHVHALAGEARVRRAAHAVVAVGIHVVAASDAAERGIAFAAHAGAIHGCVGASLGGAGIDRAVDVVAAFAGVAARRAAAAAAFVAGRATVETAGAAFAARVGLALSGLLGAVGARRAIRGFGAAVARRGIAEIA